MDPKQFDRLTRIIGSGSSRRSVLKGLGATALGAITVAVGVDRADAAGKRRSAGNVCNGNSDCASNICLQVSRGRKICACTQPGNCPAPANASATCTAGLCGFTCNSGYESNGAGGCVTTDCAIIGCPTSGECYSPGICTSGTCASETPSASGTPCSAGRTCNGSGECTCGKTTDCNTGIAGAQCVTAECISNLCYVNNVTGGPCNSGAGTCLSGYCMPNG